jgi:Dolichyl-phosphate-mannose-protein mannosyltransferase
MDKEGAMIRDFRLNRLLKPSIPAALLALFAVIIAITATRWGIGVDNDSVGYLNLWIEPGLAPLLRWMHAALGGLGVDITVASRWLFVILLATNIVLVYYALYGATRSLGTSFLGAVLVFAPVEILQDHLMVYSEPVYLLCGLIGLLLLSRHLETAKLGFLILSAVAVALAFLSRFVGLALVVTGGLSILFWSDKRLSNRILHSVIFAIISIAPTAIYLIYRTIAYETATGRAITINYTVSAKTLGSVAWKLVEILTGYSSFLPYLPDSITSYGVATAALLLILLLVAYAIQWSRARETGVARDAFGTLPLILAVSIPSHLIVWLVGMMGEAHEGVGTPVPVHARHMVPVYFLGVLLAVLLVYKVLKSQRKLRFVYIVIVVLSVGLALKNAYRATRWAEQASAEGLGYMSKTWRESELIKYVQGLDPSTRVYTNGIAQMLLYTRDNRGQVQYLPLKYHPRTGRPNSSYIQELEGIERELKSGKAVLAMFNHPERFGIKAWTPTGEELQANMALDVVWKNPEGGVYTAKK